MRFISNFLPKTLLARFMLIITIPPIIGQLVIIFLFYDRHWYNVSYYTSNIIANEIISLFEILDDKKILSDSLSTPAAGEYLNLSYEFYPNEMLPKKQKKISEELQIFKNILNNKIPLPNVVRLVPNNKINIFFQFEQGVIKVTIASKLLLNPTTYIFILWLIFLTILLLSISLIFSQRQIKPILSLAEAADSFGRGDKNIVDYRPRGAQEIRKAGIAFIKMKDRIERQVSTRTQMLAMISHDLRTPLTRIRLHLELIDNLELKEDLLAEIKTMNQMITSYLEFAKGKQGEEAHNTELNQWMKKFIQNKYHNYNITLLTSQNEVFTKIKHGFFERAITNIIDNAIKYASIIKITINDFGNSVGINIEDNGPGIKDEDKTLVFKPFYRADKSRNANFTTSVGLGLAITKEIINDIKGSITLHDSTELKGLLVTITFPKTNQY